MNKKEKHAHQRKDWLLFISIDISIDSLQYTPAGIV